MILDKIKARGDELAMLQGHARLQYLVDLAREVKPLEEKDKIEENKIRGCASNLLVTGKQQNDGTVEYKHDGDAWITKGTAKVIVDLVNGERKSEVANLSLDSFKPLGIRELLTIQRQVGFGSLIERIIGIAKK